MKKEVICLVFLILILECSQGVWSQNIPPLIGDHVGKPKIDFPNPLDQQGKQKTKESEQSHATYNQEMEVRNFLNSFSISFANKDFEEIAAFYLQEPELVVFWESQELRGWEAVRSELEKLFSSPGMFHLALSEAKVRILGRFAWVTAKYRREDIEGENLTNPARRLTWILEKKRAKWYILHEHTSVSAKADQVNFSSR